MSQLADGLRGLEKYLIIFGNVLPVVDQLGFQQWWNIKFHLNFSRSIILLCVEDISIFITILKIK